MRFVRCALTLVALPAAVAAVAAKVPNALQGAGMWEVSRSASGSGGVRQCLNDPAILAQWEHKGQQCTRVVVSSGTSKADIHYTCTGGDFGTSKVSVLTPRSVKVHTQGISKGAPFAYTLHARRMGHCAPR